MHQLMPVHRRKFSWMVSFQCRLVLIETDIKDESRVECSKCISDIGCSPHQAPRQSRPNEDPKMNIDHMPDIVKILSHSRGELGCQTPWRYIKTQRWAWSMGQCQRDEMRSTDKVWGEEWSQPSQRQRCSRDLQKSDADSLGHFTAHSTIFLVHFMLVEVNLERISKRRDQRMGKDHCSRSPPRVPGFKLSGG